jgi:hypothetical protein
MKQLQCVLNEIVGRFSVCMYVKRIFLFAAFLCVKYWNHLVRVISTEKYCLLPSQAAISRIHL